MKTYIWRMGIIVDAEDEQYAQEKIEEMLQDAIADPDGIFSYGQMHIEEEDTVIQTERR